MSDLEPLSYHAKPTSVSELVHLYEKKRLQLNPGFQRQSVWKLPQRRLLIQSVLSGYPLPAIFLYRRLVDGRDVYDVIDGKQRIESLLMFMGVMRGRFELKTQLPGSDEVEMVGWNLVCRRKMQNKVESYQLQVIEVNGQFGEIVQLFVRLNSTGNALTRQEKVNAKFYNSTFLREAAKLAKRYVDYFIEMRVMGGTHISRMKHVELMGELMLSIHTGDVLNKKSALDRFMVADVIDGRSIGKVSRETVAALNRVKRMFPELGPTRFAKLADFYTLVVLIAKFEVEDLVLNDPKRNRLAWDLLKTFALNVDTLSERQRKMQVIGSEHDLYREYLTTVRSDSDNINQRRSRERVLRQILGTVFARKDALRSFTPEQRRIIWNTSSARVCSHPGCNTKLTWEDFTIDHINPHSKGGRSQLDNAALMCRKHNSAKGNRK